MSTARRAVGAAGQRCRFARHALCSGPGADRCRHRRCACPPRESSAACAPRPAADEPWRRCTGRIGEAVPRAQSFVRDHLLREEGRRLLALALWASGRQAEALAELRRAASLITDELGLRPGDALTELETALRTGRTEVLHAAVPEPGPSALAPATDDLFVGRADDLRAAELAERRYAHDTAVELLNQAIECFALIPSAWEERPGQLVLLLGRLLRAQIRAGAIVSARFTLQRAIETAELVGSGDLVDAADGAWSGPAHSLSGPHGLVTPAAVDTFVDRLTARTWPPPSPPGRRRRPRTARRRPVLAGHSGSPRALVPRRTPPPGYLFGIALAVRSELALRPGGRTAARALIPLLSPAHDQLVSAASTSFACRPVTHFLGGLHRLLGEETEARGQFAHAEAVARQYGSEHLAAAARDAAVGR
nr:BTAD domain-containing putative transcriptional regulator [Streptomyces sp. SID12501]